MVKTKKARVRKEFRYGVNQKKKNKHLRNQLIPPVRPENEIVEKWQKDKRANYNFKKNNIIYKVKKLCTEPISINDQNCASNESYLTKIEREVKKEKSAFRLSPKTIELLSYYLDKYGEDYKAMARDIRNYNQETWKQIRRKMMSFKENPDQYAQYLKQRNMLN